MMLTAAVIVYLSPQPLRGAAGAVCYLGGGAVGGANWPTTHGLHWMSSHP